MVLKIFGGRASRHRSVVIGIGVATMLGACSAGGAVPLLGGPTTGPIVAGSPLATEAASSVLPAATKKPAPKPSKKPAKYYKPPGWDGVSDVNCKDFDTHAHAQSFFKGTGGTRTHDPYGLDGDHDAIACESLP